MSKSKITKVSLGEDHVRMDVDGNIYISNERDGNVYLQRNVKGNLYDRESVTLNLSSFNPGENIDAAERWALTILRFVAMARLIKTDTLLPKPKSEPA